MNIADYKINDTIYESQKTLILQGNHFQKEFPVLIKMLNSDYPEPEDVDRFQREFEIIELLKDCSGVINTYEFLSMHQTPGIVLEDFGGKPLDKRNFSLSARDFLLIAIRMTQILGEIHSVQVIHKDINPSNFIYHSETRQLKIIDFGISQILSDNYYEKKNPHLLEGSLSYISPEQTGRVNQPVDFRSDLYGLGATFYQLLTGRPPFISSDPLELVHCQLAKTPLSVHEVEIQDFGTYEKISPQVSEIVMKLLEKEPGNRYQSAWGLLADLKKCRDRLKSDASIEPFQLNLTDPINRLILPKKLYGRDQEFQTMLGAFERTCNKQNKLKKFKVKSELMCICGLSGIGKSALANEFKQSVIQNQGLFISGKYDSFQRKPYHAIVQAFNDLCLQILTEKKKEVHQWKKKIQNAVGKNGRVLTDIIPELIHIIGQQKDIPDLKPSEAQNRLNHVFQQFVSVFCQEERPLVLFLDDLQWADIASLKLIEILLSGINQFLFIIVSYRHNELNETHPLYSSLDDIQKSKIPMNYIMLQPLDDPQISELICDTLGYENEYAQPLAEIISNKTCGNPFFVTEFMKSLHSEKLLRFDYNTGKWQQDVNAIQQKNITENVVEMMALKIQKLPEQTRNVLIMAACIGTQFSINMLSVTNKIKPQKLSKIFQEAVIEDLIIPVNHQIYKFAHDRIQQAAYSLIPEEEKQKIHLNMGFLMFENEPIDSKAPILFDIVNQMNLGLENSSLKDSSINIMETITAEQRKTIARLNYIAGKMARSAFAIDQAYMYIKIAIQLTQSDGWKNNPDLTLEIRKVGAEIAYLAGKLDEMDTIIDDVLTHAKTFLDKVSVYEVRIQARISQNYLLEAIDISLDILRQLGIKLPEKPGKIDTFLGFVRNKYFLLGKNPESIMNLPLMTDKKMIAALRIINQIMLPVYLTRTTLFPFFVFKGIQITLKYGLSPHAAASILSYGMFLCALVGQIDRGYQFGQLAIRIVEKFQHKTTTWIHHMVNLFIRHWKESVNENLTLILDGYKVERETGNLEYAAFSLQMYCMMSFYSGKELNQLESETLKYNQAIKELRQLTPLRYNEQLHQVIQNLTGHSKNTFILKGKAYDEEQMIQYHIESNDRTGLCLLYYNKFVLSYIFEEYDQALGLSIIIKEYLDSAMGTAIIPCYYYFESLTLSAIYDESPLNKQKDYLLKISINLKKIKRWARFAPMNYEQQYSLIQAELYRIMKKDNKARDAYDRSIEAAKRNNYINELALANKRAAQFYLSRNKQNLAKTYMHESWYNYYRWGALAVTQMLENKHPELLTIISDKKSTTANLSHETFSETQKGQLLQRLDMHSVMKSMQAISSQIHLKPLLKQLIDIMIENAGAHMGIVLLENNGKWYVAAQSHIDAPLKSHIHETSFESFPDIPHEIIHYVIHTQKSVCLDDAHLNGAFAQSAYVLEKKIRSVLCIPIRRKDVLCAVIYMENNLNPGAFTKDRQAMLKLLSGQAAISIENAQLYKNLDALNKAHSRFVPHEFIQMLQKRSIIDVQSGDYVKKEMSVIFSDIRDFTSLSEKMSPEDNFKFINAFLSRMEPVIQENFGFIDKFIGDAIMALFSGTADNAVSAAIAMLKRLTEYNAHRKRKKRKPIQIGIGINTGSLMLGTVGGKDRMDGTVISDSVNLASRIEGLMKVYGVPLLISHHTYERLQHPENFHIRRIATVKVKGKSEKVTVYEVFDADPETQKMRKKELTEELSQAINFFDKKDFKTAKKHFKSCLKKLPHDPVAKYYLGRTKLNN
ncbi:multi-sensor signal transduction multi-kinase [Candidatus Magnetomorum sp. HK-1]|nr:multi-sensor signal transduction multi-kinase [Candidatus Magnetomorum sp. HK-1]